MQQLREGQEHNLDSPYKTTSRRKIAVRLVKREIGKKGVPRVTVSTVPESCVIGVITDSPRAEESAAEYFFHLDVPTEGQPPIIHVSVHWPAVAVKAAVCGKHILPVKYNADGNACFTIDLSMFQGRVGTMNTTPYLSEPGLRMSVEQHAFVRRAGGWTQIPWPETQINATNNYMFAARELMRALGIPKQLHADEAGHIAISGFETNNPPHPDAPPHWHIIMKWPNWYGGQAPHLYVDDQGRHVSNKVTIDGLRARHTYDPGQWSYLRTPRGEHVCALMITDTGGLAVAAPNRPLYVLTYDAAARACVVIEQGVGAVGKATVVSDALQGRIDVNWRLFGDMSATRAFTNSYDEVITFEPLTGSVISQQVKGSELTVEGPYLD